MWNLFTATANTVLLPSVFGSSKVNMASNVKMAGEDNEDDVCSDDEQEEKGEAASITVSTLWGQSFQVDVTNKSVEQVDTMIRVGLLAIPWPPATSKPMLADKNRYVIVLFDEQDKEVYNSVTAEPDSNDLWNYNYAATTHGKSLTAEFKINAKISLQSNTVFYGRRASASDLGIDVVEQKQKLDDA